MTAGQPSVEPHEIHYNPFDPQTVADPYPVYAQLRAHSPVHRVEGTGILAVSRYHDVLSILRDPERFSSSPSRDIIALGLASAGHEGVSGETLLGSDPPVHTRLRKIVNRGFTRSCVASREGQIRQQADRLLDRLCARSECDLIADFAVPLPMTVIGEILGVDAERRGDFKRLSQALVLALTGLPSPGAARELGSALDVLDPYFDEVVETRRREPCDDVISALVNAADDGAGAMTADELGNFIVLLLVAGNETTTNLIGNAVLALLRNPEAMEQARSDPALIPAVVEETLRWDSPVKLTLRRATRDSEIAGTRISQGEVLALLIGSANRDERVFPEPERFELERAERAHLAFGFGTHFCLGASLARLEARIALAGLLARLTRIELREEALEHTPSLLVRGVRRLRIACWPA